MDWVPQIVHLERRVLGIVRLRFKFSLPYFALSLWMPAARCPLPAVVFRVPLWPPPHRDSRIRLMSSSACYLLACPKR